ncbi:MAG: hypothetical protein QG597_3549 [Actinomycetota bacterium]|nr:hypothetical protein [Actinomycetota bacterium]
MPEAARVTLEPAAIMLQSGGDTAEAVATVSNLGEVLDQYDLEIEGLDRTWYTVHAPSVGLFPGDHSDVRISLHPPKRSDLRAGDYPFLVKAISQVDRQRSASAKGLIKIQPFAVFKAELSPQRTAGRRRGGYRVTISNSGSVDLTLDLKAADREGGCSFKFSPETVVVAPGQKGNASLGAHPKRGWFMGRTQGYDFTVTVAPQGARGDPRTLNGSFVHQPLLPSWAPILGLIKTLVVVALLAAGVSGALFLGGGVTGYQIGLSRLVQQATSMFSGAPAPTKTATSQPTTGDALVYLGGFKELHDAESQLVGDPIENVTYDSTGNGYQNSKNGTLFWLKSTNTVYFFTAEAVYVFRDGRNQTIDRRPR